jgi:hypothetical protein
MTAQASMEESLQQQADDLHEESRMILPGVQALFGFQLIAIFNARFTALEPVQQVVHLGALLLVVCAIGLLMTPAALHRIREPTRISRQFVTVSSRFIAAALLPLATGISLDVYLVTVMVVARTGIAVSIGLGVFAVLAALWLVYPLTGRRKPPRASGAKD